MPFLSILVIALMIFALVDIITRDQSQVRLLPKVVWLFVVIILPLIGSALWFALGREYAQAGPRIPRMYHPRPAPEPAPSPAPPVDTRSTEQQIADLDREIEEWRLREEIAKRKRDAAEPDA